MRPSLTRSRYISFVSSAVVYLFVLAILFRIALMIWQREDLSLDPDAYRRLAEAWTQSGTFGLTDEVGISHPTAFRPPLYPWLLHWLVVDGDLGLEWVAALHLLLCIASAFFLAAIARRLGLGTSTSMAIATLSLMDPISIRQSSLVMTETLATTFGLAAWYWWSRGSGYWVKGSEKGVADVDRVSWLYGAIAVGLVMGLSVLCRPTALPWIAIWVLGVLISREHSWRQRWRWSLAVIMMVAVFLVPWIARNQRQIGHPIAMTTHGGYTLLLANNEMLYNHFQTKGPSRSWEEGEFHRYWDTLQSRAIKRDEYSLDQMANDRAMQVIRQRPGEFLRSCVYRLGWFWAWWPAPGNGGLIERSLIGLWYAFWTLVAAWSAIRIWIVQRSSNRQTRWLLLPAISLILSLSAVHSVYWSNMRMRAPIMPAVYLLAVWSISQRWQSSTSAGRTEADHQA